MTYKTMLQAAMAAGLSVAIGLGATACSRDFTADYVYTVSASGPNINAFGVDYQSGILVQLNGSPFTTSFVRETTLVPSPDGKFLYVLSGAEDSKVEEFAVGTDGKLYGSHTYSLTGTYPTSMAIDSAGKFLYITFTYQPGETPVSPGPGGVTIFPINSDNTLGTPVTVNGLPYLAVGNNPVAVAVSPAICSPTPIISTNTACTGASGAGKENVFVYIVDQEASPNATVLGYAQDTSTGVLTPLSGTSYNSTLKTWQGYSAGVTPSAIVTDPTGRYVYVTDETSNQLIGYSIDNQVTGNLKALSSSPFATGLFPVSVVIDPRGKYLYTANYNSGNVSSFAIDSASGSLSSVAASSSFATGTRPTCITIDPALGQYLYTSNYLDGTISAGELNTNTGALSGIANSPFTVSSLPACIASVPNGPHSFQLANP
ncbi:MAG TPA: beta-propeller fold lactonase family protein [Acidobacteriaceae bacterium]|jgi:6-phosphogluconolactonase (cycloisomerase 2 family)